MNPELKGSLFANMVFWFLIMHCTYECHNLRKGFFLPYAEQPFKDLLKGLATLKFTENNWDKIKLGHKWNLEQVTLLQIIGNMFIQ
jgi:hypothetical protein